MHRVGPLFHTRVEPWVSSIASLGFISASPENESSQERVAVQW